jgi:hypothetical protein
MVDRYKYGEWGGALSCDYPKYTVQSFISVMWRILDRECGNEFICYIAGLSKNPDLMKYVRRRPN